MKRVKRRTVLLSFLLIFSNGICAQELEQQLLDAVNETLDGMAKRKGYELAWQETSLEYAWSNLAIVIPGSLVAAGVAAFVGRISGFKEAMSAFYQGSSVFVVFTGLSAYPWCRENEVTCASFSLPWEEVNMVKLSYTLNSMTHYSLDEARGSEEVRGSCMLYYVSSTQDRFDVVDYELDDCSDNFIFPQRVSGHIRTEDVLYDIFGNDVGNFFDEKFGQDNVVTRGRVYR